MTSSTQTTRNAITLKGSATIIADYLNYGINSILFQRGIYPPESFQSHQQYGLTILMSTDNKIKEFLKNVLTQAEEWLSQNELEKIVLTITNVHTKEILECWDFQVQNETPSAEVAGSDKKDVIDKNNPISTKEVKEIQKEIASVMRQISATVSYLPLLDCICAFDVLIYTLKDCVVPEKWNETEGAFIQNSQVVKLRSFSTGLHSIDTVVNYKMTN